MLRELKQIIKYGKLGQILHFQAQMPQEGFIRLNSKGEKPVPQQWRLSDREVPTIHLDLATHLHEIIYYLTNEKPLETISDQASDGWFKNVIDNVSCLCRYSNNIQGQIWFSKSALGHRNGLEISIYGTKGSVNWVQMNPEELTISFVDGHKQILDRASSVGVADQPRYTRFKAGHPAGFIEAFANLYCDITKVLIEYKETGRWTSQEVFDSKFATEGLRFLESMVLSSKTKKWEKVDN
jgi:predicted dehydrogenase